MKTRHTTEFIMGILRCWWEIINGEWKSLKDIVICQTHIHRIRKLVV